MTTRALLFYILAVCLPLHGAVSEPSALPAGRLVLLLHEADSLQGEAPTQHSIGPITMRAAIALSQKPGIVIVSPHIWHNLLFRIDWFATQLTQEGSLASLFHAAWNSHQKHPGPETHTRIHTLLKADPSLLHHLYLWKIQFDDWHCWRQPTTHLMVFVPKDYLEARHDLLPRNIPLTFTPPEIATGLRVASCTPVTLPQFGSRVSDGLRAAKHGAKRAEFSLSQLQSLFIEREQLHPLITVQWNIYASGHGSFEVAQDQWRHILKKRLPGAAAESKNCICGLPLSQFAQWISFCNRMLTVNSFYYQSCYGGGQNLSTLYELARAERSPLHGRTAGLHFPLIVGSIGDTPTSVLMPRKHQRAHSLEVTLAVDIDLCRFFEGMESDTLSWEEKLKPVTQTIPNGNDAHALTDTPQLLLPGSTVPRPLDVTDDRSLTSAATGRHLIRSGIHLLTAAQEQEHRLTSTPLIISGKRAILLMPPIVRTPLELYPYQKIERGAQTHTIFCAPALVSLLPGNALHHCTSVRLHKRGLKAFLTESFLDFNNQKSTKVFIIDSLTLENDLEAHFNGQPSSLWNSLSARVQSWFGSKPEASNTPEITLEDVIIIVGAEKLTCFFGEPRAGEKTIAQKTTLYRPQKDAGTPAALSRIDIGNAAHKRLLQKYLKLCKKQGVKVAA